MSFWILYAANLCTAILFGILSTLLFTRRKNERAAAAHRAAIQALEARVGALSADNAALGEKAGRLAADNEKLSADNERLSAEIRRLKTTPPEPAPMPPSPAVAPPLEEPPPSPYPEPVIAIPAPEAFAALPGADALSPVTESPFRPAWDLPAFRRGSTVVVPPDEFANRAAPPVYILGDLHGDASALRRILAHLLSRPLSPRVVFLGDLVDRAPPAQTLECARLLLHFARSRPGSLLWLRGNHDSLAFDAASGSFSSGSLPHDFADFLNAHPEFHPEGRALASLMAALPVAAVLGDVFLSHGGVLQDDDIGLGSFAGLANLTPAQISDLLWSRMRDVRSKLPARAHSGAEVGFRQAEAFARRLGETDGVAVRHFVCGHQHEVQDGFGYLPFARCFSGPLTCQCVTSFLNREAPDCPARPAILQLDPSGTPVPVFFPIPD